MKKPLVISNYDPAADEVIYCNDIGCWNVSRALRDCKVGKHKGWLLSVEECYRSNERVEVDEAKVTRFMAMPDVLAAPLLAIVEGGPLWLIDGHHRLRALQRLGVKDCKAYVIEEADAKPYQIFYNGKRKPPFKTY
jgi:hypothetical protein